MKRMLSDEELELVTGGFLLRDKDGSYIVVGESDVGFEMQMNLKKDFDSAVAEDWSWFKKQYKERNIKTLEELRKYYNYGNF
ncbi:MAG: hypothetical protein RUMPE_00052 [Eubacteriales bacterium SKADARSKE-1]|nr:hypothetical protein [Eubacteriales bacterium SKADARSKE-1]